MYKSDSMRPRVVHVLENISALHGGSTTAAFAIAEATSGKCSNVLIGPGEADVGGQSNVVALKAGSRLLPLRTVAWLYANRSKIDIVEIHNVFSASSLLAILYCFLTRQNFVLNPHNSLDEMDLRKRRRLKQIIGCGFLSWALSCGGQVRCATKRELERLEMFGGYWNAFWALLPIPIKVHLTDRGDARLRQLEKGAELKLLFMSRIDRKKRLDILLEAIGKSRAQLAPYKLIIAGTGDRGYELELKNKISELKLDDYVEWRGFVRGAEKINLLRDADAFILPSAYENFGIVVLEALACGLRPVVSAMVFIADHLTTEQCMVVADDYSYSALLAQMRDQTSDYWADAKSADSLCTMLAGPSGGGRIVDHYVGTIRNAGGGCSII
jgi:glycosyltransferase involved in cell wall biosynthesis